MERQKLREIMVYLLVWTALLILTTGCATSKGNLKPVKPVDRETVKIASLARAAFEQGAVRQAAILYKRALQRAQLIDDPEEIANNAYNLAACLILLEQYDKARALLQEAQREFRRTGGTLIDAILLEAKVTHLQGNREVAESLVDQALHSLDSSGTEAERRQAHLLKAQLACEAGNIVRAREAMERAELLVQENLELIGQARFAQVQGCITLLNKEPAKAAEYFDRESKLLQESQKYWEMPLAMKRAGEAYEQAGNYTKAANRYYRAARSLYVREEYEKALTLIQEKVLVTAERAGDIETLHRAISLMETIQMESKRR